MSCSLKDSKDMLKEFGIISDFHEIINKNDLQEFEENLFESIGEDAVGSAMGNPFFIEHFPGKSKLVFNRDFFRILDNINNAKIFKLKVLRENVEEEVSNGVTPEGTSEAFEKVLELGKIYQESSELQAIGSQEQYAAHVAAVFPESQEKRILYHGTVSSGAREQGFQTGVTFLTSQLEVAGGYVNQKSQLHEQGVMEAQDRGEEVSFENYSPEVLSVVVNIQNPYIEIEEKTYQENHETIAELLEEDIHDAFVSDVVNDSYGQENQIAVFSNQNIHALNSPKDVALFQEYVSMENQTMTAESIFSQENAKELQAVYDKIDAMIESNEITVTCKI